MSRCVVDASALVRAASRDETGSDLTRSVLVAAAERVTLAAPALVFWEVGQAIARKGAAVFMHGRPAADVAADALAGVDLDVPGAEAQRATLQIAQRRRISVYDAAYLELAARTRDAWLLSEDERLLAAAREELGPGRAHDARGLAEALR